MSRELRYLSSSQVGEFYTNGYLRVPNVFSQNECDTLLDRSKQLLEEFDTSDHPMTTFSTGDDDRNHVGDDYFLNSGDKIRFFFEEDAVDQVTGALKEMAVNKFGHALHELDPVFRHATLENDRLRDIVLDLAFHVNPSVLQSMVICKQSRIGGEVPEHCDSTFLFTDPLSALGFWIPLEQCTADNGALAFLPGSHQTNCVVKRFVRLQEGGTGFESLMETTNQVAEQNRNAGVYKLLPCGPGDLVLIHGSVLHRSGKNETSSTRFAYTFHMIESEPLAKYDEKNWLQPTTGLPFTKFLQASEEIENQ